MKDFDVCCIINLGDGESEVERLRSNGVGEKCWEKTEQELAYGNFKWQSS
jgi:hypothetical protein